MGLRRRHGFSAITVSMNETIRHLYAQTRVRFCFLPLVVKGCDGIAAYIHGLYFCSFRSGSRAWYRAYGPLDHLQGDWDRLARSSSDGY